MTLLSLPRRWQRGLLLLCLLLSVPAWSADILLTAAEDGAGVQAFVQALTQQRPDDRVTLHPPRQTCPYPAAYRPIRA